MPLKNPRSRSMKIGIFAHAGLLMLVIVGSMAFVWMFRSLQQNAHATGTSISVNKTWYFAEGRVGGNFAEFLTLGNPDPVRDCSVTVQYLRQGSSPVTKTVTVFHASRLTLTVNNDLNIPVNSTGGVSVSAIVSVNATPVCNGIVAERPMYFSYAGVNSGSDVVGATQLNRTFYFGDVPTGGGYLSFITILNPPGNAAANVSATYYVGGRVVGSVQSVTVQPGTRGTIIPNNNGLPPHVSAIVTSDQPVMAERPNYFGSISAGSAGVVSGAASVVGVQTLANDWLFAEGYTGNGFQEYFALANVDTSAMSVAHITIHLEYSNGTTRAFTIDVNALDQVIWDVNANAAAGSVSAEITSTGAKIVVERKMFFHYNHGFAIGGTDVIGQSGPAAQTSYSFAEGYNRTGYNEWLTMLNPTGSNETIYVTLVNGYGRTYTPNGYSVSTHTRYTLNITSLVLQHMVHPGDDHRGYEVSMTVQTIAAGAFFIAERPMYWNTEVTQGGTDVIGYTTSSSPDSTSWSAFDGGGQRSGVNNAETLIGSNTVSSLTRLWQHALPATVDGTFAELPGVSTPSGVKDLLFATTKAGSLLALDAATGNQVWRQDTSGPNFTTSSPALDPSDQFVYSYGLDGKVHKYAVSSGTESTGGGWPATITLMPNVEKGSSSLNTGNGYLYMTTSGYPGDAGHYEGHIVAVNLSTGATTVFNALCANIHQLLDANPADPNYCSDVQTGIWARAGVVIDPVTGNVFVTTGNGSYTANTGGHNYGDSVIELSPDLTRLIDTYTPSNYAALQASDLDLGSASPAMLPRQSGSLTPYLAVQAGKDTKLRLLNRQNLSSMGGPDHVGGELQTINLPQGCDVDTHPVAWNDANNVTWVFVANSCGLSAFKVVTDGSGHSTLQLAYQNGNSGSSPFIANGVLFVQGNGVLRAMTPTTGATLWSSTQGSAGGSIGSLHWQSPLVVNGQVDVVDDSGNITAYGLR